jgi:hypothetical protein
MWRLKIKSTGLLKDSRCMKVKAFILGYVFKQSHLLHGNK